MKNILLTTTALATLAAGSAFAGGADSGLEIKLGGELDAQMGFRSQKTDYVKATAAGLYTAQTGKSGSGTTVFKRGVTPGNNNVGMDTVAAVHATIKNKTASGLVYGANVGVQTTTRSQSSAGKHLMDRTYLFMESDMGRVEIGTNESAANAMRIGADRIARATGGIDGDWNKYVALDTFNNAALTYTTTATPPTSGTVTSGSGTDTFAYTKVRAANFITSPGLVLEGVEAGGSPVNKYLAGDEKSRKITYFTPEYNGFQAGLSYIPDTRNTGQDKLNQLGSWTDGNGFGQYYNVSVKNALSGGLSWHGTFDKMHNLKVALVGESGKVVAPGTFNQAVYGAGNSMKYNNVKAYALGAQWNYKEFAVAASYGHTGKSLVSKAAVKDNAFKNGKYWTLGAAWNQGPWAASVTYMNSKKNNNKFSLVSVGADYELAPGLMPYAEVSMFTMKQKNDYWSPLLGRSDVITNASSSTGSDESTAKAADPSKQLVGETGGNYKNANYKNKGTAFILGTKINF